MNITLKMNGIYGGWSQDSFEIAENENLTIDADLEKVYDPNGVFDVLCNLNGKQKKVSLTTDKTIELSAEWLSAAGPGVLRCSLLQFNKNRSRQLNVGLYEVDDLNITYSYARKWAGFSMIGELQTTVKKQGEAIAELENKIFRIAAAVEATGIAIDLADEGE